MQAGTHSQAHILAHAHTPKNTTDYNTTHKYASSVTCRHLHSDTKGNMRLDYHYTQAQTRKHMNTHTSTHTHKGTTD